MKTIRLLSPAVLALALGGCGLVPPPPRWDHYMGSDLKRVAVMRPIDTGAIVEDAALDLTAVRVTEELVHRGFEVLPKDAIDAFYQKKGVGIRADMLARYHGKGDQLAKELGVDGVLWTSVSEWGKEVSGIMNNIQVKIEFILMGTHPKDPVWQGSAGKKVDLNAPPPTSTGKEGRKGFGEGILGATAATLFSSPDDLMPEVVTTAFLKLGHAGYK